jgi:hypothetical protein
VVGGCSRIKSNTKSQTSSPPIILRTPFITSLFCSWYLTRQDLPVSGSLGIWLTRNSRVLGKERERGVTSTPTAGFQMGSRNTAVPNYRLQIVETKKKYKITYCFINFKELSSCCNDFLVSANKLTLHQTDLFFCIRLPSPLANLLNFFVVRLLEVACTITRFPFLPSLFSCFPVPFDNKLECVDCPDDIVNISISLITKNCFC